MNRTTVKRMNRMLLLSMAPFIGMLIWLGSTAITLQLDAEAFPEPETRAELLEPTAVAQVASGLDSAHLLTEEIAQQIIKTAELYEKTNQQVNQMVKLAAAQVSRPGSIYDRRITNKLGTPSDTVQTDKLRVQLFYISAQNFKGYALKVKLKSKDAMTMVLGKDEFGKAETTLEAARRYNALAGINAGGFADQSGNRYPLSTTVLNGAYVNGFQATFKDLFFVGINNKLKLVGGKYTSKEQLDKEETLFGASFVPILLKNGSHQAIPKKWQESPKRAARTVIANYKDDQLLFLVTDAADENGRSGASLAELQILLSRFGVKDAYNLDGGGSSTLVFKDRVINKPSDGTLRKLATNFLLFE